MHQRQERRDVPAVYRKSDGRNRQTIGGTGPTSLSRHGAAEQQKVKCSVSMQRLVRMYYGSGTVTSSVGRANAAWAFTRRQHFSAWNDVLSTILSLTSSVISKNIRLRQSIRIYLKNNFGKFHFNPIWNDWASGFLKRSPQQQEEQQQDE